LSQFQIDVVIEARFYRKVTMTESLIHPPKRVKIEGPTVINSNECITFHLLKKVDGNVILEEDGNFPAEMTHQ